LASWWGTGVFAAVTVAALVLPDVFRLPAVIVDMALFALGTVAFLWAFAISVERSRYEILSVAGIYFLAGGVAPATVRAHLMVALGTQTLVGVASAALRPFTSLAFGILVPMFGLGVAGRWGARHGSFPEGHLDELPRKPTRDTNIDRDGDEADG
jgi:hypothetical protein